MDGSSGRGEPLAGSGGVAALFTMGTGAAADVGDGRDAKMWTLTQRDGNPSFLSLLLSFSAFLLVPLTRAGVKAQRTAAGARCRAACNQLLHAGRRRVARAPTGVRASAVAASCVRGGTRARRGFGWRGLALRGLFGCLLWYVHASVGDVRLWCVLCASGEC